jgi:hypothetical protein
VIPETRGHRQRPKNRVDSLGGFSQLETVRLAWTTCSVSLLANVLGMPNNFKMRQQRRIGLLSILILSILICAARLNPRRVVILLYPLWFLLHRRRGCGTGGPCCDLSDRSSLKQREKRVKTDFSNLVFNLEGAEAFFRLCKCRSNRLDRPDCAHVGPPGERSR